MRAYLKPLLMVLLFLLLGTFSSANQELNINEKYNYYWHCSCKDRQRPNENLASFMITAEEAKFLYQAQSTAKGWCQELGVVVSGVECKKLFILY